MTQDKKGCGKAAAEEERDRILSEAVIRIKEKKYAEAERLLKPLLPDEDSIGENETHPYLSFNEPMEEIYYRFRFKPGREIGRHSCAVGRTLLTYAYLLVQKQEFDEALRALGKGLRHNPIDTGLLFEEGEIFKIKRNWTVFRKITDLCLSYACRSSGIARAYRNFGYMLAEQGDYDGAACCYLLSREYEDHAIARGQLERIARLTGREIDERYYHEHFRGILEERKIQVGPSKDLLNIAGTFASNCEEDGDYPAACYFYNILFDLTRDGEIEKKLIHLKALMETPRH
jgi:tetratricopeptide (TPR) repeat protein